ncbi:hypothetical protein SASPL_143534 [Salvia splendens]|uniref:Bifunctional dihydroflavonol 4-reductase/flavanone 4-reductase n=1 Tax=Salvia splendens TaxID=180675 RepID=A0A8X8ZAG1_SALSN|nr:hypothetical protein SASPL_143534 [Salvia splendens]
MCSSHNATIYDIANLIREKWPEYSIPTEFEGIDKNIPVVSFSSKKLEGMGFSFKYTLEEMFRGAIDSCREKGLLPLSTQSHSNGENKESTLNSQKKHITIDNQDDLHSVTKEKQMESGANGKCERI